MTQVKYQARQVVAMQSETRIPKQYQHFVPQFFLRNFSHPFKPSPENSRARTVSHGGWRKDKIHHGEPVVNHVDLSTDIIAVAEKPVRRVLGQNNMYSNTAGSHTEQNRLEEKLSRLESDASAVFRKILTAFNQKHRGSWLTREERNLVRKFLFIMKYRGPTFYDRYHHETIATYSADDKEGLIAYMDQKGFSRPIDVWLDNLNVLTDLQMDEEMSWFLNLPNRIYPHDALWATMHCQMMYMAICTPLDPQQEFLVTDNCYHVTEGPQNVAIDPNTGKLEQLAWLGLHEFAPISPRLIIVLRSFLFPRPEEDDANPQARSAREQMRSMIESSSGSISETLLANLPVSKARNNYTELVGGSLRMLPGQNGTLRQDHSFFFKFFPIGTDHVNRINGVFLDNLSCCNSLVFNSKLAFRHSLEWYMTDCVVFRQRIARAVGGSRLSCLKKLEALLRDIGSNVQPHWDETTGPELLHGQNPQFSLEELWRALPSVLAHIPDDNPTEFMNIYHMLGGSKATLAKDMEQTALMMKLRIKIDVWSQGVDEAVRQRNRELLTKEYRGFPRRRLWIYLKRWRMTVLEDATSPEQDDFNMDGPEDAIAKSSPIIKSGKLNEMMYDSVGGEIFKKQLPGFDPWASITFDQQGFEQLAQLREFALCGKIQNCGLAKVEEFSRLSTAYIKNYLRLRGFDTQRRKFTLDEVAEMQTRIAVRDEFMNLVGGRLDGNILGQFTTVFFELLYPTPPSLQCLLNL